MDIYERSLEKHKKLQGKIEVKLKADITTSEDLSLLYSPGVAEPCRKIAKCKEDVYRYTGKGNTVAVVSDGSAVLGLGNIGPEAALPVMEGKAALFKKFANIDAIPICLDTQDATEIVSIVKALGPTFGGINLEDISAPRCVEIERKLVEEMSIPVFHDDQHGTAIVVTAGLINALKVVNKQLSDITVVVSGAGAAGSAIIKTLHSLGVHQIYAFTSRGILLEEDNEKYNFLQKELSLITNRNNERLTLEQAMQKADVFIGVSAPNIVTKQMVTNMRENPIIFALANPEPEIGYQDAIDAGAAVVATGRSDLPNQINYVLAFPGLFRGALDSKATKITMEMQLAAAYALSAMIPEENITSTYIIPHALDENGSTVVANAVANTAKEHGTIRK